jgi:hypothetical protein
MRHFPVAAFGRKHRVTAGPQDGRRQGGATALPVFVLLLFSLFGPLAVGLMPRDGQTQFAIVAAPWKGAGEMVALVAAADGAILDAGGLPNVIFARSDSPDFAAAAYRAGAWLVLDPVLLRGCLGSGGRTS